ncbi:MAG: IPT/TIG domain-containing protein [Chloroflexi bacterium]|nr:IPT/TIG domain-containing protein [Chloroflexota bacterium]
MNTHRTQEHATAWRLALLATLALASLGVFATRTERASGLNSTSRAASVAAVGDTPVVTSVSPASVPALPAAPVSPITVTGQNFIGADIVNVGLPGSGSTACLIVGGTVTATSLQCSAPAKAAGSYVVQVHTATGGTGQSSVPIITYGTAPTVTNLSPNSGPSSGGAGVVIITGTGFSTSPGANVVTFGGNTAQVLSISQTTAPTGTLTVSPPAGSGTVDVRVTVNGVVSLDTGTLDNYTYTGGPTVTLVSPNSGPAGTLVTVTGTGFSTVPGATTVAFGGLAAAVNVISSTSLQATSPANGTGTVNVVVTVANLSSVDNGVLDDYTYGSAGLTITSITPTAGPLAGGNTVTIVGTGFNLTPSLNTVTFGGAAATVTASTATSLTVVVPASATAGAVNLTVTNQTTLLTATATGGYTYTSGPIISSITPNTGSTAGGTLVTITGANFPQSGVTVFFGNVQSPPNALTVNLQGTQVTITSPAQPAGTVSVRITAPNGTSPDAGTADDFTYTATGVPTVTGVSPNSGPVGGGTVVTLTGTGFSGAAPVTVSFGSGLTVPVTWNPAAATGTSNVILSDSQIRVTSPAKATAGAVNVTVTTGSGTSISTATFTYGDTTATITYQLFPGFTLIGWGGKNGILVLDALKGIESPDNPATVDISAKVGVVYKWSPNGAGCRNGEASCWLGYFPGSNIPGVNDFTTFVSNEGYFISILPGNTQTAWVVVQGP